MPFSIKTSFSISFKKKQTGLALGPKSPQQSDPKVQTVVHSSTKKLSPSHFKKKENYFFSVTTFPFQDSFYKLEKALEDVHQLRLLCQQNPQLLLRQNKEGNTALHLASQRGHLQAMALLCETAPQLLLKQNKQGNTALHLASEGGHLDAMTWLCQIAPQFLLKQNKQGNTALHLASQRGHLDAMTWLSQADPQLLLKQNKQENTVLHLASQRGHLDAMTWLCQTAPQLLLIKNLDGNTAFHLAVSKGHLDVVIKQYHQNHDLIHQKNKLGLFPLEVALYFNQQHVKKFLVECHCISRSLFSMFCIGSVWFFVKLLAFLYQKLFK